MIRPYWDEISNSYELKSIIHPSEVHIVQSNFRQLFVADPSYPENIVHTVYFSTPFMNEIDEKLDSDNFKEKFRIRAYSENLKSKPHNKFLENKTTLNGRRIKKRKFISKNADFFESPFLYKKDFSNPIFNGPFGSLIPTIYMTYRRIRGIDVRNKSRVNLDLDIRVVKANNSSIGLTSCHTLPYAVFEAKASEADHASRSIRILGGRQADSFSKFILNTQLIIQKRDWNNYGSINELLSSDGC